MKSQHLSPFSVAFVLVVLGLHLGGSQQPTEAQSRRTPARAVASPTPQRAQPSESERLLWQEALKRDTRDAFEFYLREFPQGSYVREARAKIAEIEARAETAKWDSAVATNTRESFESYLKEYPNGRYSADARERVKKFERDEEDALWKEADRKDDTASYNEYLKKYPRGVYSSVARLRLSSLGATLPESVGSTRTNSIGMQLAWIPSGSFMMGSTDAQVDEAWAECKKVSSSCERTSFSDETPQRLVTIRQGFWMGRYEVTQGQYEAVMGTNPSYFKNCGKDCPVEMVSWNDAKEFIKRLNDRNDGLVYSLPSEAEWEYAARAGTTGTRHGNLDDIAWYVDNAGDKRLDGYKVWSQGSKNLDELSKILYANGNRTRKVGLKQPNGWGLHDMLGNVWEWVEDIYNKDGYSGLPTDGSANTTRGDSSRRVLRGGSWFTFGSFSRSADRFGSDPSVRYFNGGFRVVARAR